MSRQYVMSSRQCVITSRQYVGEVLWWGMLSCGVGLGGI